MIDKICKDKYSYHESLEKNNNRQLENVVYVNLTAPKRTPLSKI